MRKTAKKRQKGNAGAVDECKRECNNTQQTATLTICKLVNAKKRIKQIRTNITRFSFLFIVFFISSEKRTP